MDVGSADGIKFGFEEGAELVSSYGYLEGGSGEKLEGVVSGT